jgi:hypothetical protein
MQEIEKRLAKAGKPAWVGGLGGVEMAMALQGVALPPSLRRIAEDRLSTLRSSLSHRDRNEIAKMVLRMLSGFPSARQSDDDARNMVGAYVDLLGEYPPWAVDEARQWWIANARKDWRSLAFPPSAVEWADGCQRITERFSSEISKLVSALAARGLPPTPKCKPEPCLYNPGLGPVGGFFDKPRGGTTARFVQTESEARTALAARCAELGVDPKAIDAVPDQPLGFRKIMK